MNDYIQNKKSMLQELETMLSKNSSGTKTMSVELSLYCEIMKRTYLECSTNN